MTLRAVVLAALTVLVVSASKVSAQEKSRERSRLAVPTAAFAGAAVSDWVTTYYGISHQKFVEGNRLISPLQDRPALMISAGAAMDVGALMIWKRYVGRNHPKLAAAGLYAVTGVRLYFCWRGVTLIRQPTMHTAGP